MKVEISVSKALPEELPKRGPFKLNADIVAGINKDMTFNYRDPDTKDFVEQCIKYNLGVEVLQVVGPGGGNPEVNIHGTKPSLKKYLAGMGIVTRQDYEDYGYKIEKV